MPEFMEDEEVGGPITVESPQWMQPIIDHIGEIVAAVKPGCSDDEFYAGLALTKALWKIYKAAKAKFDANAISKILDDGEISIGETRYFVGPSVRHKCVSAAATLDKLLSLAGGDFEAVANCLSSNAWKPGAVKDLAPEQFPELFQTTTELDIKTGKPRKALRSVNPALARKTKG